MLLFVRMSLMGDGGPPVFAAADNPTAKSPSLVTRTLTFLYLPAENVRLLVHPRRLSFDWSMDAVAPVTSVYDPRNALSVVLYAALFAVARRSAAAACRTRQHHHNHRSRHRCCSNTKYDRPDDHPVIIIRLLLVFFFELRYNILLAASNCVSFSWFFL